MIMHEHLPVESQMAVIKLITTGDESRKAFEPMQVPIEGLDHVNDPALARGDEGHINELFQNVDMLFIATSAGDVNEVELAVKISGIAREQAVLSIVLVQVPMALESSGHGIVKSSLSLLRQNVDTLLIVPSEADGYALQSEGATCGLGLALAAKAITEPITVAGLIRVDFADVRTVMSEKGVARVGFGCAVGDNRAREAADQAISNLNHNKVDLADARAVLINITAGLDIGVDDFDEVTSAVKDLCSDGVPVVAGVPIVPEMGNDIRVTVVATGID